MAFEAGSLVINVSLGTANVTNGLNNLKRNVSSNIGTINKTIVNGLRNFKKVTAPIVMMSKAFLATVTGHAAKALHALYTSPSKAGKAWKATFNAFKTQVNVEMSRIGAILLKTPIFGKTIPKWMDTFVNLLKKIDTTKVKELVKWFERITFLIMGIKAINILGGLAAGVTGLIKVYEKIAGSSRIIADSTKVIKGVNFASATTTAINSGTAGKGTGAIATTVGSAIGSFFGSKLGRLSDTFKITIGTVKGLPKAIETFIKTASVWSKELKDINLAKDLGYKIKATRPEHPYKEIFKYILKQSKDLGGFFERIKKKTPVNVAREGRPPIWRNPLSNLFINKKTAANAFEAVGKMQNIAPLVRLFAGLRWIFNKFNTLFLPLTAIVGFIKGVGLDLSSISKAFKFFGNVLKGAFGVIWKGITGLMLVFDTGITMFSKGFEALGIITRGIFTLKFNKMATELDNMWKKMINDIGVKFGNWWVPLDTGTTKGQAIRAEKISYKEQLRMYGGKENITGQYVGLTEGVKFAQDVQKRGLEYQKEMVDLARRHQEALETIVKNSKGVYAY